MMQNWMLAMAHVTCAFAFAAFTQSQSLPNELPNPYLHFVMDWL